MSKGKLYSSVSRSVSVGMDSMDRSKFKDVLAPLNYINGKRCDRGRGNSKSFECYAPYTGEFLCSVPGSSYEDVDAAVGAAEIAFKRWRNLSGFDRGQILERASCIVRQRREDIARVEVLDCGKPIYEARIDIDGCADTMHYYAGLAACITGEYLQLPNGNYAYTRREPLGIVGAIGAWNYPFQMAAWKSAPALATGNTMIFKPSPLTPLTAVMLAEIYSEAGLPDGCFNVVQGQGDVGEMLCTHKSINKMTFTGSVNTGIKVMETSSKNIKHVSLELGGKSAILIFDDCNLENAVKGTMLANFLSQGQVCSNAARVFVQKNIVDEFTSKLVERTRRMKIGNPFNEDVTVGSCISDDHRDKILSYIQSAIREGATIECGGEALKPDDEKLANGHYITPCILSGCRDDMTAVREEIFGPVITILPFTSEDEAVERANDTPYGLAGGVFTQDLARAHRVTSSLEAGSLYINTYNMLYPGIPFGGYKMSGIGRENGASALDDYSQIKSVTVETNDIDCPF